MLKACLFDLDGTLLDTLDDLAASVNTMLSKHGFPLLTRETTRQNIGDGMPMLVRRSLPTECLADEAFVTECIQAMRAAYALDWDRATTPYSGIPETLEALLKAGVPLGVLSNKPHEFTLKCVARYFPGVPFRMIFGQRQGIPIKPDPAAALEAISLFEVLAEECAYIGDSGVDMRTSRASGMYGVGALWGFRDREELEANGADILIAAPGELVALIEN